jgi:hypothetical protein
MSEGRALIKMLRKVLKTLHLKVANWVCEKQKFEGEQLKKGQAILLPPYASSDHEEIFAVTRVPFPEVPLSVLGIFIYLDTLSVT